MTTESPEERYNRPWADTEDEISGAESTEARSMASLSEPMNQPAVVDVPSAHHEPRPRDLFGGRQGIIVAAAISAIMASLAGIVATLLLRPCPDEGKRD